MFDGTGGPALRDRIVHFDGGRITEIRPASARDDAPEVDILAPGFIDMQINGAADTQFNFDPSAAALRRIAHGSREGGTAYILPTFITAAGTDYARALDAVHSAVEEGVPGILGLHLEGPFLSHLRPGIHDPVAIRQMDESDLDRLTAADVGTVLLTLAPEALPAGMLKRLTQAGLRVFAGHTEATADQIAQAEAEGLVGVTHLFNAMSQMTGRAPGVVGAAFASETLFAGIIADGHHVDWRNIAVAARLMPDRLCLVTDAMLTLAGNLTQFELHGEVITQSGGRLTNAAGTLAGAHVSMIECVRNMHDHTGVPLERIIAMASGNPARALGLERSVGTISEGARASFTCLTGDLGVAGVIVDGRQEL
nr:N-acetylglucosamine-6-phosphate deacetylase [Marivita sp. GX14005]